MRKTMKSALALLLVASTLLALLMFASCGITSDIEGFLTSDNYTFKAGKMTIMVDKSTVYYTDGNVEKYLYLSKAEGRYYYCEAGKGKKVVKEAIDSEEYIVYHNQLLTNVSYVSQHLTAFLQVAESIEASDGVYTVGSYSIKSVDGVITCTVGKSTAEITAVGSTVVEIPEAVLNAVGK